jgi:hypothetical protein
MGQPAKLRQASIAVTGELVTASLLEVGNPQCVVLGPLPDPARFNRLGPALAMGEPCDLLTWLLPAALNALTGAKTVCTSPAGRK